MTNGRVLAVARADQHRFSKSPAAEIAVIAGLGVEGDAPLGTKVQHRARVAADPSQPNLRQVHLIHAELLDELRRGGFEVRAGQLGENITTEGVELLALPRGAVLRIGDAVILEVTGLRSPCGHIERFQTGLLAAVIGRRSDGDVIRKTGVMSIVLAGGGVRPATRSPSTCRRRRIRRWSRCEASAAVEPNQDAGVLFAQAAGKVGRLRPGAAGEEAVEDQRPEV